MIRLFLLATIFILMISCETSNNKTEFLRNKIGQIISGIDATVGVSIIGGNGSDTISVNGDNHCPLQSVFKLHIAIAILSEIDKENLSIDQKIEVHKEDLLPGLWSPLRDENPEGGSFTIARLIQYSVSQSDNVACDILIRLLGSPKTVEEYFKKNNIERLSITFNEEEMQAKWENMYQNWTTPKAASETLKKFFENKNELLSKPSYDFFWRTMKETTTGGDRLKGLLPEGTVIAHKTGTSGTNKEGLTPATNDIGIVFLPDGQYFIISIFVTDSRENEATNEKIIADIARATYDFYTSTTN